MTANSDPLSSKNASSNNLASNTRLPATRRSFRNRLLVTLGPILSLAIILTGVIAWVFAYSWLTYSAQAILDVEIREIAAQIITQKGALNVGAYHWNEPHHRFDTQHIDPYFLQVFDKSGHLVLASANIGLFSPDTYPSHLLTVQTPSERLVEHLHTFNVADKLLYHRTKPILDKAGRLLGYIQVARYDPGISHIMRRTAYFILLGLAPVLLGLLGIVWWSARRVVAPLEQITKEALSLSSTSFGQEITVPLISDSETALLATSLNSLLGRLEQSFKEMQRFTADAAHELQTPLTILKGHVSVALRRERSPEEYQKTLRILLEQTEGLIHLVHNLLQLARVERGDQLFTSEPVDLVAIVTDAASHYKQEAENKRLDFVLKLPESAWIDGRASFVNEIVTNLLDNAVKYTEQGHIFVYIQKQKQDITLVIEDTGVGMPEEVRRHATDRFFRASTANAQSIPGSGLGLALVEQITASQNAQLKISSTPKKGTTVKVTFQEKSMEDEWGGREKGNEGQNPL